jgi:hypothetical protein
MTGIPSLPPPQKGDDTAGAWISFGVGESGQLDKANGQTRDAVSIVKKCEARDQAAADAMKPKPWFQFW